jgi:hypothetical protein
MMLDDLLPIERFRQTLEVVDREAGHLAYSRSRLAAERIDADWVASLAQHPELAERLEAFVSRFGRMQDTIADKLLPRWLLALAEKPGSQIEVLNRAERLGVVQSTEEWLAARKLRKRLVHEYSESATAFAADLELALRYTEMLMDTDERVRSFAATRMPK